MCGENLGQLRKMDRESGSPPRVRGKPLSEWGRLTRLRITPACAGKTLKSWRRIRCPKDHPRVCGENVAIVRRHPVLEGSPPRVRGKRCKGFCACCLVRITPACAGKTDIDKVETFYCKDHPRVCGENAKTGYPWKASEGSPPRVRGKHARQVDGNSSPGITPACAGKTTIRTAIELQDKDHPRVCGENYYRQCRLRRHRGSPPRVRGKHRLRPLTRQTARITPACAGKTSALLLPLCPLEDHPRVCGENRNLASAATLALGSPPRVRGKPM